ncbi:MAG TPA: maleylpyruvate isomerase N-terminal domain-containing protein, partial [Pseudonocardiaceae bacterium]
MSDAPLIARAAAPFVDVVRDIKPDQLTARTPCTDYSVRDLVNHLLIWGPPLEGAARKEFVPPLPSATD